MRDPGNNVAAGSGLSGPSLRPIIAQHRISSFSVLKSKMEASHHLCFGSDYILSIFVAKINILV